MKFVVTFLISLCLLLAYSANAEYNYVSGVSPLNFSVYQIISDNSVLITFDVVANNSISINTMNYADTALNFVSNTSLGNITMIITRTYISPVNTSLSNSNAVSLKYVNISANNTLNSSVLAWNLIKIYYTDAELAAAGIVEDSLSMYMYNSTSDQWIKLTTSLNEVFDTGINKIEKYVWVNSTFLSLYAIGGLKADGQSCLASAECYSNFCCNGICQSFCPSIVPSGPSAGAGMPIVAAPTIYVEFSKTPVLREVIPGQSVVAGIIVKNKGNSSLSGLHVEVSSIPKEWVTVIPQYLDLDPYESSGFSIGISVPSVVAFGDYKVVVTLKNQNVQDTSFFILRVKSFTKQEDKPIVERIVEIDRSEEKTNVELNVYNPLIVWKSAEVVEYVPKEIANSTALIEFNTTPSKIIQSDPIVSWEMIDMAVGETRKIRYSVSNILEEFTSYIYWPFREINLVKSNPVSGLEIIGLKIPMLYSGTSSIATLTIRNLDKSSHNFGFELKIPSDWKSEPKNISAIINGGETRQFGFSIILPEKTIPGYYAVRGEFLWDDSVTVKEYGVEVAQISYQLLGISFFMIFVAILTVYIYFKIKQRKIREQLLTNLRGIREKIEG